MTARWLVPALGFIGFIGCIAAARPAGAQTASPPAGPSPASGATVQQTPQVKIGGTIFADVAQTIAPASTDTAGQSFRPSSFDVTRAYVNVSGSFNPTLAFRVTSDIARETGSGTSLNGSYTLRLKFAYAQLNLDKWTGAFTQTWIRVGLSPTPFVEGRDSVYRYRFQGSEMPERDLYISSSDAGISAHANLPGDFGDVQVSWINGEGYQKAEVNGEKALQMRATLRPAARASARAVRALRVSGFVDRDHYMANAERRRAIGTLWYEHAHFNAGVDVMTATDRATPTAAAVRARGWDAFVTPFFAAKGHGPEALLRVDVLTRDTSKPDQLRRLIAGVSYWWTPPGNAGSAAAILLDYEDVRVHAASVPTPDQKRLYLHALVTF